MQTGFNTNCRYQGIVFHVQTEDGGITKPRVVTHLFQEGNVLASLEKEYADFVAVPDLGRRVQSWMKVQHQEMLRQLIRGDYDQAIRGVVKKKVGGD